MLNNELSPKNYLAKLFKPNNYPNLFQQEPYVKQQQPNNWQQV